MPRINVRLGDVESGFQTYPEDTYLVEIQEKTRIGKSQEGEPKIIWIAKIMEGEYEGKYLNWNTSLQDQALWNLKGLVEALGLEFDEDGFDLEDTFGLQVAVDVTVGEWNGQPRNYVNGYHAV
jgi:hypothetical protein